MLEITSKDWYVNQKYIPDNQSSEYKDFWDYQRKLCTEGCVIDGVFINPYLYWHLNFWHTEVDVPNPKGGKPLQHYINPLLRDNEWIIYNSIWEAEQKQKGLAIGGCRRLAKSVIESSYLAHGLTFDKDSQNVLAGLNAADIKLITDKIDKGLNALPEEFLWMRIEDNWNKQVTLGFKDTKNKKYPFSQLLIRNIDGGSNEEAIAGSKPRKLIFDEFAKGDGLKALLAAEPGFTTPYGWTCSPIITFTGGDTSNYHDAKELFYNPDLYNYLEFPHEKNPELFHGLFMGHKYRQEAKVESNLAEYLEKDSEALSEIKIMVSDPLKADEITDTNLENKRIAGDVDVYLKEKMYFPKTVEDIFVSSSSNIFNRESIQKQIDNIIAKNIVGQHIELYHDGTKICWKTSDKKPITEYPFKKGVNKDCPIVMYEQPIPNAPWGLYVAGIDPYRQPGNSKYSNSLGCVCIFKRAHKIDGEGFNHTLVAIYYARPNDREVWNDQARLLLRYYNAYARVENDELSFIDYMKHKKDAEKYLSPQPDWLKKISPFATQSRDFGVSRAATSVRNLLHGKLKTYLEETLLKETAEDGTILNEVLGVARIMFIPLLQEILLWEEGVNTDALVAMELALSQADDLDPLQGEIKRASEDSRLKSYKNRNKKHQTTFKNIPRQFSKKK